MSWKTSVSKIVLGAEDKVVELNLDIKKVKYSDKIIKHREINNISGDEEVVRAFLVSRLVNELGYKLERIELEKEYDAGRGTARLTPRIDIILRDNKNHPYFFIECKAPDKFESDKEFIKGQLFELSKLEGNVKYLVYYTIEETEKGLRDKLIIIDREKFNEYEDWLEAGEPSISNELSAHYGKPRKKPLVVGGDRDLVKKFQPNELKGVVNDLHNVLWGGGGTDDREIFNSLVKLILAKIQDEYDRKKGEEYHFQIHQHGDEVESTERLFERINTLYRKALEKQLNMVENLDQQFVINQQKFSFGKLVYTVQKLEEYSFVDGKSTIDGKDILGDFFEQIQRDGFKQDKGQFFTPINIVRFLLYALEVDELALRKLNDDKTLPYIIDPSCGSGTFLIEAMKMVTKELKYRRRNEIEDSRSVQDRFDDLFMPDSKEHRWARTFIYAIEHNPDLGTATKVNMILHGDGSTNTFVKDGLLPFRYYQKPEPNALAQYDKNGLYNKKITNSQFDVLVSNPPFSVNLDNETKSRLNTTFVFHNKKNSENLFIERFFQLLKENGRMGVVLPESVFDTTENKYIRLFIYKYFLVRAVISLPQITFEPFTSTKTSLLLAQRKTDDEIREWDEFWAKHSNEFGKLKTRAENYIKVYVEDADKNKYPSIKDDTDEDIKTNLSRFLQIKFSDEENNVEIKFLIEKFQAQIVETAKIDNDTKDVFGYVNTSWVFREVAKEIQFPIFMAEAENIGYKRTKRGEKWQPNELFDLEIAPESIDVVEVRKMYSDIKEDLQIRISEVEKDLTNPKLDKQKKGTYGRRLKYLKSQLNEVKDEEIRVLSILNNYYQNGDLLEQYKTRLNDELKAVFLLPRMERFKSDFVLIRQTDHQNILDNLREAKLWR